MKINNKVYNIKSDLNKKIALISDLHYASKYDVKLLDSVLNYIKDLNPDYICIPGDIINESNVCDEMYFIDWLKRLSKICKTIISIGNHEFYINKKKKLFGLNKALFEKICKINNIYLLDNKSILVDNINFTGITIPYNDYGNKDKVKEIFDKLSFDGKHYNVLLCHSPGNIFDAIDGNINLVLCGHMHGGVVPKFLRPMFKTRGFISPNYTLFPKYAYGHIKVNNADVITTSGIKVLPYKHFNYIYCPEVVSINLKK